MVKIDRLLLAVIIISFSFCDSHSKSLYKKVKDKAEKIVVDKKGGWKPFYKDESGTPLNINLKSIFTTTISTYAVTAGGFRLFKLAKARMNKTMPGQLL
mgnify:CR=1 FL=1